jgi:hypothetical protein
VVKLEAVSRTYYFTPSSLTEIRSMERGESDCPIREKKPNRIVGVSVSLDPLATATYLWVGFRPASTQADLDDTAVRIAPGEARSERANAGEYLDLWGFTIAAFGVTSLQRIRVTYLIACDV